MKLVLHISLLFFIFYSAAGTVLMYGMDRKSGGEQRNQQEERDSKGKDIVHDDEDSTDEELQTDVEEDDMWIKVRKYIFSFTENPEIWLDESERSSATEKEEYLKGPLVTEGTASAIMNENGSNIPLNICQIRSIGNKSSSDTLEKLATRFREQEVTPIEVSDTLYNAPQIPGFNYSFLIEKYPWSARLKMEEILIEHGLLINDNKNFIRYAFFKMPLLDEQKSRLEPFLKEYLCDQQCVCFDGAGCSKLEELLARFIKNEVTTFGRGSLETLFLQLENVADRNCLINCGYLAALANKQYLLASALQTAGLGRELTPRTFSAGFLIACLMNIVDVIKAINLDHPVPDNVLNAGLLLAVRNNSEQVISYLLDTYQSRLFYDTLNTIVYWRPQLLPQVQGLLDRVARTQPFNLGIFNSQK